MYRVYILDRLSYTWRLAYVSNSRWKASKYCGELVQPAVMREGKTVLRYNEAYKEWKHG